MLPRSRNRLSDDQAAEVLASLTGPTTRQGHRLRAAALALTPAAETTQSEPHRKKVLDVMLRTFERGDELPIREMDAEGQLELPVHAVTMMNVGHDVVVMSDLDAVDSATAARAALRVQELLAEKRR